MERYEKEDRIHFPKKQGGVPQRKRYLREHPGIVPTNIWLDIKKACGAEHTGYPTQNPLKLYNRIIRASSNEGDIVLDPFCGCATTLATAEHAGRQWVGMDIWDRAHEVIVERLNREKKFKLQKTKHSKEYYEVELDAKEFHFTSELLERTDDGETAAPFLKVKRSIPETPGRKMSRDEIYDILISEQGVKCQGCDRKFDHKRYLELDHNTPRADGGINHISNRILLCSPCNWAKSNTKTLSGLRAFNRKEGWMAIAK